MAEQIQMVPLSRLVENPKNPRKLFGNLTEFSKTLKGGVLQPLVATALPDGKLQIVIGHRRFRGGKIAGLKEVPVIIREYTDEDARTAMIVENYHREDVNPMELAESFAAMRQDFGLIGDQIADRVKLNRTEVYDLLALHDHALEPLKKAILGDKLGVHSGMQIARMRGERLQNTVLERALKLTKPGEKHPPVRAVKKLVQGYLATAKRASKRKPEAKDNGAEVALRKLVVKRLLVRVAELVERKHHLDETDLRTMAIATAEAALSAEATREVFERRGIRSDRLGKVGATQLRSLVVELALAPFVALGGGDYSAGARIVAKAYGLSIAELEKNVTAKQAAEALFK